jgi:cold shock CspA family protein
MEHDMQTPLEIDFQGLTETPEIRAAIEKHVAQFEELWGRVTAGRVMLKAPSHHHREGGLYEIHVRLLLPDGREVNVEHTATADERRSDFSFALNNAFKRARRQLEEKARRTEGDVKHHDAAPIGTVVRLDPSGEFGFLETKDGQEVYFHRNSVIGEGYSHLRVGSRVTFAEEAGEKGTQASTVKLLGKHGLR